MALSKALLSQWYLPSVHENLMTFPNIICILPHIVSDFPPLDPFSADSLIYSVTCGLPLPS